MEFADIKFPVFSIKYFVILFNKPIFLISYLSTMSCKNIDENNINKNLFYIINY